MEITKEFDSHQNGTHILERITIGDALFALIVLGAAVFRFYNLGIIPLNDAEALKALSVWQFWLPGTLEATNVGSPAYFSFTAPLTQIVGFSDSTMRVIPAIFGVALVILPRFLQHRLGVIGVLVSALLLAISPLNLLLSRTVGGDAIALFAILLVFVAFIRYQETAVSKWLYTLTAAIGLGLASSTLFLSGLLTLGVALLIQKRFGLPLFDNESLVKPENEERNKALIIGGLVLLLSATMFLWNFIGIGDAANLIGEWFNSLITPDARRSIADPLLAILRYEPLILVLGVPAVIWAIWRSKPMATTTLYWMLTTLLIIVIRRGDMANAALLTIPSYLLLGLFVQNVLGNRLGRYTALVTITFFVLFGVIAINIARYLRVATYDPSDLRYVLVALMALVLIFMTIYVVSVYDISAIYQGAVVAILAFYVVVQWGIGLQTANYYANDPRERWVVEGTDQGVRYLSSTATDISRQVTGGVDMLNMQNAIDSPALAWYLRDFKSMQIGEALPNEAVHDVVITSANTEFPLEDSFTGTKFRFKRSGYTEVAPDPDKVVFDLLRWWFFHETPNQVVYEDLILWVRTELIQ